MSGRNGWDHGFYGAEAGASQNGYEGRRDYTSSGTSVLLTSGALTTRRFPF